MGHDGGWRRAMGASVTVDGGCTNNKMAAGGAPPPPSHSRGMRRDASLARGRKGCFAKGENAARVPCQFFPNVWPFEILAEPRCKASRSPPIPSPWGPPALRRPRRIQQLLKTTRISSLNIFGLCASKWDTSTSLALRIFVARRTSGSLLAEESLFAGTWIKTMREAVDDRYRYTRKTAHQRRGGGWRIILSDHPEFSLPRYRIWNVSIFSRYCISYLKLPWYISISTKHCRNWDARPCRLTRRFVQLAEPSPMTKIRHVSPISIANN